jgi:hypothetical protein
MSQDNQLATLSSNSVGKFDDFSSMEEMQSFATTLLKSKILPDAYKTPEAVIATVIQGKELGLKAMTALQNIHFISGKPTLGIHAISALLRSKGIDSKVLRDFEPITNSEGVTVDYITTVRFYRYSNVTKGVIEEDCSFTWTDANAASLTGKDVWKKFPKNMMYARAYSNGARRIAGDVLLGIYETSEMADSVGTSYQLDADGNVILPN